MDKKLNEAIEAATSGSDDEAAQAANELQSTLAQALTNVTLAAYEIENGERDRGTARLEEIRDNLSDDA